MQGPPHPDHAPPGPGHGHPTRPRGRYSTSRGTRPAPPWGLDLVRPLLFVLALAVISVPGVWLADSGVLTNRAGNPIDDIGLYAAGWTAVLGTILPIFRGNPKRADRGLRRTGLVPLVIVIAVIAVIAALAALVMCIASLLWPFVGDFPAATGELADRAGGDPAGVLTTFLLMSTSGILGMTFFAALTVHDPPHPARIWGTLGWIGSAVAYIWPAIIVVTRPASWGGMVFLLSCFAAVVVCIVVLGAVQRNRPGPHGRGGAHGRSVPRRRPDVRR